MPINRYPLRREASRSFGLEFAAAEGGPSKLPLEDIQGNVVHGYAFPHAIYLFFSLSGPPEQARSWLSNIIGSVRKGVDLNPALAPSQAVNLAFTYRGLQQLGWPDSLLETFPDEFRSGMASQADELGDVADSAPGTWEFGGPNNPKIHGLITLHGRSLEIVKNESERLQSTLVPAGKVVYTLAANALEPDPSREHFGYRDGIGQPAVLDSGVAAFNGQGTRQPDGTWAELKPGELLLGYPGEAQFPFPSPKPSSLVNNGTFLVFRKLYQDVALFRQTLKQQANAALGNSSQASQEWVASRMAGRWRSGAPVDLTPHQDDDALALDFNRNNDFDYANDQLGKGCPVGAHIRRMNPRGGLASNHSIVVKTHRIMRRGLPYGPQLPQGITDDDGVDRGVAFMALNASIKLQFRFVQKLWMNSGDFAGLGSGSVDPVSGQSSSNTGFQVFRPDGSPVSLFHLPKFVRMKGGEYFFIPGITALSLLAQGKFS